MGSCSSKDVILPSENSPQQEIRFLQSAKTRIDRYFYHLYNNIKVSQTHEEVVHVRDGVEELVRSIVKKVGTHDSRFVVEENCLLKVGSFYEGTKLGRIDQFDYIVALSSINSGWIEIEELTRPFNGIHVAVFIDKVENREFSDYWKTMIYNSCLVSKKTRDNKQTGILDVFLKHVQKVINCLKVKETKFGRIELDKTRPPSISGPSVKVLFTYTREWHELVSMVRVDKSSSETITVNITPAIKVTEVTDFMSPLDSLNETIYNELLKTGSFLLIASEEGHFKKVFTETETRVMKSLHQRHLKAFCVIKYVFNGINKHDYPDTFRGFHYTYYDSYALKMLMIMYSRVCPCKDYTEFELFDCVMFLLMEILQSLHEECNAVYRLYPNVFLSNARVTSSDSKKIQMHRLVLTELIRHDLKYWIGEREKYDFSQKSKQYGVTPLHVKMLTILKALNL